MHLCRQCYPSYYCLTGRDGNPVYYERSGQVDQPRLKAAGCGTDELVWCVVARACLLCVLRGGFGCGGGVGAFGDRGGGE